MSLIRAEVEKALHTVYDPCSIASQSPVSVIDMGMVSGLDLDGDAVHLRLLPTNLGCTLVPSIMIAIEEALAAMPSVGSVSISIDKETHWSPDQMSERGREMLGRRRAQAQARFPVQSKQWMLPGQEEARRQRLEMKRKAV
ncbi:hypothetical protein CVO77_18665 [Sphingopyxis lindanitolerans]|uniref:MIP18 family-like domain-containing protein n=1 Tax=Sphingopyxis lindanitolerans TaxID=2054227 RepID=A0A2S8B3R4_9SPHN|nr:iron-sulfur cluster assembly protein [Sphingopyxis lindanitolerans]PQM26990.1 hypothetical protein CVO77_18665 [Sphingopyxis lindanitolerans]